MDLYETLDKYVQENFSAPESEIFHYTKPELGKQILDCGFLKLSPHHNLNERDNRELTRGIEIIKNTLTKKNLHSRIPPIPLFDHLINKGLRVYIASFCELERSQYSTKKYGSCCLCFSKDYIKREFRHEKTQLIFGKVKYHRREQEKIISEMIDLCEKNPGNPDKKLSPLLTWLTVIIPFLKEERDSQDVECRLVSWELMDPPNYTHPQWECPKEIKFKDNDVTPIK